MGTSISHDVTFCC